ncbi:MAG: adenylate/guanylate cyclase domain-containing protein [Alphaproteobacteria bacterium]|nr:adenylate/guanylate cyclase domain-containing protein [Alphaproteobacteria bacterium]
MQVRRSQGAWDDAIARSAVPANGGAPPAHRRLAAVLVADMVGYTRLMQVDEELTYRRLTALRTGLIEPLVAAHSGWIAKNTGDGFIVVFDTGLDAVRCAIELQRTTVARARAEPADRRISFRVGINIAEIIVEPSDVFGDGVNVSSRLQTYAEPGGIIIADVVADQLADEAGIRLIDLGELPLRNRARPVRAFSLRMDDGALDGLAAAAGETESRASIVVMPFREQAAGPASSYFAEGIVDDIIHGLSGLRELFVISRGSTLGLDDRDADARAIGRELGVRYVLRGRIDRTRDRIQIRTELDDAATGTVISADRYDGAMSEIFDLHGRIAMRVVKTIAPHVRERELLRAMRKHPQNMTAYDLLLQALDPLFRMEREPFTRARALLQQAVAHDPSYGPAYSYAAYWHLLRVGQGWSPDVAADSTEAARAAAAAIERDGNDALALAIQGHVHSYLHKDYETAMELQNRAVEAGPSCAMAWTLSSATCGYLGLGAVAVARAERGLELSPRGPHVVYHEHILSQAHYVAGNHDAAVEWGRRAAKHNEGLTSNLRCLAAALVAVGRIDEAREIGRRIVALAPELRLQDFAARTPLRGDVRDRFIQRLRTAGIPD